MSKLAEFRAAEKQLAEQLALLESLKNDSGLKKEIEFEERLKQLLSQYGKSLRDIVDLLDPVGGQNRVTRTAQPKRRERAVKVYRNPQTGEVVETKGGNHKVLKAWKAQYGAEAVESWLQS